MLYWSAKFWKEEWRVAMEYKILVLDIDGTLTNSKKEITPAPGQR